MIFVTTCKLWHIPGSCENGNPANRALVVKSIGATGTRQGGVTYQTGNPYCDPARIMAGRRTQHPPPPQSSGGSGFSTSGYASSSTATGDYADYADIDNFDMTAAGMNKEDSPRAFTKTSQVKTFSHVVYNYAARWLPFLNLYCHTKKSLFIRIPSFLGYVSDGDLLSANSGHHHSHNLDSNRLNDGYLSESGVSIYGRRVNGSSSGSNARRDLTSTSSTNRNGTTKHGVITEDR